MAKLLLKGFDTDRLLKGLYPLEKLFKSICRLKAQSGSMREPLTPALNLAWYLCMGRIQIHIRYLWMASRNFTDRSTDYLCQRDDQLRNSKRSTLRSKISTTHAAPARYRSLTAARHLRSLPRAALHAAWNFARVTSTQPWAALGGRSIVPSVPKLGCMAGDRRAPPCTRRRAAGASRKSLRKLKKEELASPTLSKGSTGGLLKRTRRSPAFPATGGRRRHCQQRPHLSNLMALALDQMPNLSSAGLLRDVEE